MGEIVNKCKTKDFLTLSEIEVFATDVKNRTGYDIQRLKDSIIKNGFLFPLFIWKGNNVILDGKARYLALKQLAQEGNVLEEIPVVFVEAKDENEAKEKVLQVNSRYGKITEGSLNFFAKDCKINISDLNIHLDKINFAFDNKHDLVKKGVALVVGNSASQIQPQPVTPTPVPASSALEIGGTQRPMENVFTGNDGAIEQAWADSQQNIEIPSFEESEQSGGEGFGYESIEPEIESYEEQTNVEVSTDTNSVDEQHAAPVSTVPFTCPFCYTRFELTMDEVKEILAQ